MMNAVAQAALSLSAFPLSVLLKATVILGVAFLILRCMRPAAASARHLVLAAAFAVLAVLPAAERVVPTIRIPIDGIQTAPLLPITRVETAADVAGAAPLARPGSRGPSAHGVSTWSRQRLLLATWGLGAFVCLVPVLLTPWRLRELRRTARRWGRAEVLLRTINPTARPVAVFLHDEETAPVACGIVRPAILLPAAAAQWSEDDITRALIHELEHVRRGDWPVFIATRIVSALYWFHPLVWVAWRRLGLEAERASDDAVLRGSERTAYAQQLVTLAKERWRASAIPVLSMAGRSDLSARVAAVLDERQSRGRLSRARAAIILAVASVLLAAVGPLRAQAAQNAVQKTDVPEFDVVSIRENKSAEQAQNSRRLPGGRIIINNLPLRTLIISAFGLQPQQLAGAPDWIDSARYDITAQTSGEPAATEPGTVGPLNLMMQRMLADRFQLAVHTERRELPIYALTLARSDRRLGPRIRTAAIDCQAAMNEMMKQVQGGGTPPVPPQRPDGGPGCGMRMGLGTLTAGGTSMAALGRLLAVPVGRLVEDRTGLAGGFDFDLEYTVDRAGPGAPPSPSTNAPSIFTALEEQLGLKLQAERAPVEVLVIDRVERPTEN